MRHDATIFYALVDGEVEGGRPVDGYRGVGEVVGAVLFRFGQDAEGLVGGHAESRLVGQGEDVVVSFLFGFIGEPGVAVRAVLAADAVPRRAAVHAQVPDIGYCLAVVGLDVTACRDVATQQDLRRGGGSAVVALRAFGACGSVFAVFTVGSVQSVGADGVTVGVGQGLAVQRPVPVAVLRLREAYLRRLSVGSVLAVGALRTVIDGDRPSGRLR